MDEFLVPMNYTGGDGLFVCVGFAGLNRERYDSLEIELEQMGEKKTVKRDAGNVWQSEPAAFEVTEDDIAYKVNGYVTVNGETLETHTFVPARRYEVSKRLLKAAATVYTGGAISTKPQLPIVSVGD